MKLPLMLALLILLTIGRPLEARSFKGSGHAVGGSISLGGLAKKLVIPNAIPFGKLTGVHGYEVWDFSDARDAIQGHNRASFCFSAIEFTQDFSTLDLAFGGEGAVIRPVGQCPKDLSAVAGEDLIFSVSYDIGQGTKSIPVGISFSYGFDLSLFTQRMLGHFAVNNPQQRTPAQRLYRLHSHLLKYLMKNKSKNLLNPLQSLLLKLFISPTLMLGAPASKEILFAQDELDFLARIASKKSLDFNQALRGALHKIKKDSNFYSCKDYTKCEEMYVDFLMYADALMLSLSDCHTISFNSALLSNYGFSLTTGIKFELGFGYSVTAADKTFTSKLPTGILAARAYAAHNFTRHSKECSMISQKNGQTFGDFLRMIGHGRRKP